MIIGLTSQYKSWEREKTLQPPHSLKINWAQSRIPKWQGYFSWYLVRVADVRKPSRYAYKLPSKTGHSEYSRIFARSLPSNDFSETNPDRSRVANNLKPPPNGITNYQSTYSVFKPISRWSSLNENTRNCWNNYRLRGQADTNAKKDHFSQKQAITETITLTEILLHLRKLSLETTLPLGASSASRPPMLIITLPPLQLLQSPSFTKST